MVRVHFPHSFYERSMYVFLQLLPSRFAFFRFCLKKGDRIGSACEKSGRHRNGYRG